MHTTLGEQNEESKHGAQSFQETKPGRGRQHRHSRKSAERAAAVEFPTIQAPTVEIGGAKMTGSSTTPVAGELMRASHTSENDLECDEVFSLTNSQDEQIVEAENQGPSPTPTPPSHQNIGRVLF